MPIVNAVQGHLNVGDPVAEYETMVPVWKRCRAVCSGERYAKDLDALIDCVEYKNLLVPFSPSMTQQQYNFYKAEAELPGISAEFSKSIIGGLLRKAPDVSFSESISKGVGQELANWLVNSFGEDDMPLTSFLSDALYEELQTGRAWVYLDYPAVSAALAEDPEIKKNLKPYPILWKAEDVINTTVGKDLFGKAVLKRVITRKYEERAGVNEFHAEFVDTVRVYEIVDNYFQVRVFQQKAASTNVPVVAGNKQPATDSDSNVFELVETITNILMNGERLRFIPAWPLSGSYGFQEPIMASIVDREVSLYNKLSRRNHLLYGAATYTPYITSDMADSAFKEIVDRGLGSWFKINQGDTAGVLDTPTEALADMDRAIKDSYEEMAKLGVRMLAPEVEMSGVALAMRTASQSGRISLLNTRISAVLKQILIVMIKWRTGLDIASDELKFEMSQDYKPLPKGADWLRLITEWYEAGLIPRSVWLNILKHNDIIDPSYNDEKGVQESLQDSEDQLKPKKNESFSESLNED